ncbi:MAG: hypothetical protein NT007_14380 [Candidatus Kapabacteria bacterium]|nr:hypothetical protein [Candidatus Kapabacteria bacterium]
MQLTLKPKCLELIAKEIGSLDSEINLQKFLIGCGVDKELIEDKPNKWRMVYDVMLRLSTSENKPKDALTLFEFICKAVHPFVDKRDEARAEKLLRKFNSILKFDCASIYFDEQEKVYKIKFEVDMLPNAEQEKVNEETSPHYESLSKKNLQFLCRPENKEKISLLRKMYILLMDVVSIFCENPSEPTTELNNAYQYLDGQVWGIINSLKLKCSSLDNFSRYPSPFVNLFSAEKFFQEQGKELCWQKIRPGMHAMYGEIENLHQVVNGSDILSEPDEQEKLNEIELTLSECKEELEEHKKQDALPKPILPIPLEVTINTPQTSKIANVVMPKVKLSSVAIKYDDNAAVLYIGDQKCQLPPFKNEHYKNEHYLCRALFESNKHEMVDWDVVYEKITGYYEAYYGKPADIRNNWHMVYDTMKNINKRIKEAINTDDDLFTWQEKTIKRNY